MMNARYLLGTGAVLLALGCSESETTGLGTKDGGAGAAAKSGSAGAVAAGGQGGKAGAAGQGASAGNGGAPGGGTAGTGAGGAGTGGTGGGSGGSGAAGSTAAGGTGGAGTGGTGTAGAGAGGTSGGGGGGAGASGKAGSGTAGSGTAGSGTAGSGTAGGGTAGSGTGGSGTAGNGGMSGMFGGGPCPDAPPPNGDECKPQGLVCDYGTDPREGCRTTATCDKTWQILSPKCPPLPDVVCPATRADAAGAACAPDGAYCSYAGLVCSCTNCSDGPVLSCNGQPTWHCEAPNADQTCPAAKPNAGVVCSKEGQECRYACGDGNGRSCTKGVWAPSSGGPCPVSVRRAKSDIHYLEETEVDRRADEVERMRLATYEYTDPALRGRRHLGFIIEDQPGSESVDPERNQVDLYGYTSLLVSAVQRQSREIEALRKEVSELRGKVEKKERRAGKGAAKVR